LPIQAYWICSSGYDLVVGAVLLNSMLLSVLSMDL
jgi:hypothetical protein